MMGEVRRISGSSPRMRGARETRMLKTHEDGIIPAYAGSTQTDTAGYLSKSGSSPRMRGARLATRSASGVPRIIPAYAGSTSRRTHAYVRIRDHPRVCGEHSSCAGR